MSERRHVLSLVHFAILTLVVILGLQYSTKAFASEVKEESLPKEVQEDVKNPFEEVEKVEDESVAEDEKVEVEGVQQNPNKFKKVKGETIIVSKISIAKEDENEANLNKTKPLVHKVRSSVSYSFEEMKRLAVFIEERGETVEERRALASVVVNRLRNSVDSTLEDVLFAKNQFGIPANIDSKEPKPESFEIAILALNGHDYTEGAVHYHLKGMDDDWHKRNATWVGEVGNIVLYKKDSQPIKYVSTRTNPLPKNSPEPNIQESVVSNHDTPKVEKKEETAPSNPKQLEGNSNKGIPVQYSEKDLDMMARIIWAEARGEEYLGKVAVGATIINRLKSGKYGNTLEGVLFAKGQYQPMRNGSYKNARPTEAEFKAAREAFDGVDPTKGAHSFYAPHLVASPWHESLTHTVTIGVHKFFK